MRIASAIALGELRPGSGSPDVVSERGRIADRLDGAGERKSWFEVAGDSVLLRLDGMRFLVERGERIRIDAPANKPEADIRIWLLGTVMAALLHQRDILPLHANLVALGHGGAAAFAGSSGAGKSTLAAWFEQHGRAVLGDDLCAVHFDATGRPLVYPGVSRVKLWQSSIDLLGRSSANLARVASDIDKYHVPLTKPGEEGSLAPFPLDRVYLLDRAESAEEPLISRLNGAEAAAMVLGTVFRWQLGDAIDRGRGPFDQCLAIARRSVCFRLARRFDLAQFDDEARAIGRHLDQRLSIDDPAGGPRVSPDELGQPSSPGA